MPKYVLLLYVLLFSLAGCYSPKEKPGQLKQGDHTELKGDDGLIGVITPSSQNDEAYRQAIKYMEDSAFEKAIIVYRYLCRVEPDTLKTYAYMGLATAYLSAGEYKKAVDNYKLSLTYNPKNAEAYNGLGSVFLELIEIKTAIAYYDTARNLNNKNTSAYWGLALCYERIEDTLNAKANARKFIELAPGSKYRHFAEDILKK
jgi:tetratricopeptide (TPR) repeat protein